MLYVFLVFTRCLLFLFQLNSVRNKPYYYYDNEDDDDYYCFCMVPRFLVDDFRRNTGKSLQLCMKTSLRLINYEYIFISTTNYRIWNFVNCQLYVSVREVTLYFHLPHRCDPYSFQSISKVTQLLSVYRLSLLAYLKMCKHIFNINLFCMTNRVCNRNAVF